MLQIKLPKQNKNISATVLAGDIGATKSNLGLFRREGDKITLLLDAKFKSTDYEDIGGLTRAFLNMLIPDTISIGVAGPVLNGHAKLANLHWEVDSNELALKSRIRNTYILNDLEATCYGLAMLAESDIALIHEGGDGAVGNAAVIAPGTGLGEAGMYWDGEFHHPFATEGGHCDFAPRNDVDYALYSYLQKQFGHVSWERLLSGPGIMNIYHFLRDIKKMEEPQWLKEEMVGNDPPAVISQNVEKSQICKEAMRLFICYCAYECANLALKVKATGGLFIGGGIAPQIVTLFKDEFFYASFCQAGRVNYLLEKIPIHIILNPKTALLGAAYYGANC